MITTSKFPFPFSLNSSYPEFTDIEHVKFKGTVASRNKRHNVLAVPEPGRHSLHIIVLCIDENFIH